MNMARLATKYSMAVSKPPKINQIMFPNIFILLLLILFIHDKDSRFFEESYNYSNF